MILQTNDLVRLRSLEKQAADGVEAVKLGMDVTAIAIYEILNEKLYLAIKDDRGLPLYGTQEEYIPVLARQIGLGRTTIFKYKAVMDFAFNTLELSENDFIALGGKATFDRVKSLVGDSEVSSSEIIATLRELKHTNNEDELNLSPGALQQELQSRLVPNAPIISYYGTPSGNEVQLLWFYEKGNELQNGSIYIRLEDNIPKEVVQEVFKKLNIR